MSDDDRREVRLTGFAVIELAMRLIDEGAGAREEELEAFLPAGSAVPDPRMVAVEAATFLVNLIDATGLSRRVLRALLAQERESVLVEG